MATRAEGHIDTAAGAAGTVAVRAGNAQRVGTLLAGAGVLALAASFHLYRLAQTPGWDPQEGYNLDLAWNLLHGRLRLFGLTSAFAQHPPLFYLQLALLIHLFGYSVATLRALVAVYALLTCGALLTFGRRLLGTGPALWSGLVFTGAPLFLANTRWGYSYAQLMFVGLLCVWATWRYTETGARRWLLAAALLAGIGVLSDYEGVALVGLLLLAALRVRPRDALVAGAVGIGLPLAGMLACLAVAPGVFAADLASTLGRAAGGNPLLQLVDLLVNYYRFVVLDPWVVLGLVGLFLERAPRPRTLLLASTGVIALVALKVRAVGPSFHTAVPLLPLLALGAGVALDAGVRLLYTWTLSLLPGGGPARPALPVPRQKALSRAVVWQRSRNALAALVVFLVIVSPLAIALAADAAGLATTLPTRQDATLATAPADAQAVAGYVLAHERAGDLTLGSPQIVWMLDQPDSVRGQPQPLYAADALQALAYAGQSAAFYPAGLPRTRWAFPVALDHARYVIVDDLLRQLAQPGEVPGMAGLLATATSWPAVYQRGEYTIYERPGSAGR
jgi:4-amino-4-deoxy-L-arabinose transferase-like glycosyltransferase